MRFAALVFLAGCALPALPPPADLTEAQRTLARVEVHPFAEAASEEIRDAEVALTAAERAHAAHPSSVRAFDEAYLARRAAEKAAAAAVYQAEREGLFAARGTTARLAADLERRDAFFADLARRRAALAEAQGALRRAHLGALARAPWIARVEVRPDAIVACMSADDLFLRGTSLLRDGGEPRLAALAAALLSVPPLLVRLAIPVDLRAEPRSAVSLTARRTRRVHDMLVAHGVPEDWFLAPVRSPAGTEIEVGVVEPALPLPPSTAQAN